MKTNIFRVRRWTAPVLALGLATLSSAGLAGTAAGSPAHATPGVPADPAVLFTENLANNVGTTPVLLTSYVGATGETYTADPAWLTDCNGSIVKASSDPAAIPPACTASGYDALRQLSYAQGVFEGASDPTTVPTLAALTGLPGPGPNKVQFQTIQPIPIPTPNRYLTFSVDVGGYCTSNDPALSFFLLDGATRIPLSTSPIDPCTDPRGRPVNVPAIGSRPATTLRVGTYVANGSALFSGSSVGIQLINGQGAGSGNDSAITNIRILDATPQLDKAFTPTSVPQGGASALTFTITNTSDLAAKDGWSFTDALPAGLTIAGPAPTSTCPNAAITGAAGATSVSVTGDLGAGMSSCTVTVNVTSPAVGRFTNTPAAVTPDGLNPPGGDVVVDFTPVVDLAVAKSSTPNPYVPGQALTYTVTVTNAGPSDAVDATVSDPLPAQLAGAGFTWTCAASAGGTCTASGTGDITDTVDVPAGGNVAYTVTGTVPANVTGQLRDTATVTPPSGTTDTGCSPSCGATDNNPPNPKVGLAVTKTSTPASYQPGGKLTYTVTVTNAGPSTATGATVSDPLPAQLAGAGFTWTCAASTGGTCTPSGTGDITDTVDVPAGGKLTYTVTGTVPTAASGAIANTATVTPPPNYDDAGCTPSCAVSLDVSRRAAVPLAVKLAVAKKSTPDPYLPGQKLTYTVTVTNAGPGKATNAKVTDKLPKALVGKGFTWTCKASTGATCTAKGAGSITDTVTVPANGKVTYTVTGTVPAGTTGELVNTATVTPAAGTTDSGCTPDCAATATVPVTTLPITGSDSRGLAGAGLALVALGMALVLRTRRCPARRPH